jgi:hypothetical protein
MMALLDKLSRVSRKRWPKSEATAPRRIPVSAG